MSSHIAAGQFVSQTASFPTQDLACQPHTERAWIGNPCPGRRCSTGRPRSRAAVRTAATSSTVSGAKRACLPIVITASPDNSVRESSFHSAILSSVCPGVLSTVHAAAHGSRIRSSRPPDGRGPRQSMPRDVPKPTVLAARANPAAALPSKGWPNNSFQVRASFAIDGVRGFTPSKYDIVVAGR
jgi:hypothetical protein